MTGPMTWTGGKKPKANIRVGLSGSTSSRWVFTSRSIARNVANDRPMGRMMSRTQSTAPSHGCVVDEVVEGHIELDDEQCWRDLPDHHRGQRSPMEGKNDRLGTFMRPGRNQMVQTEREEPVEQVEHHEARRNQARVRPRHHAQQPAACRRPWQEMKHRDCDQSECQETLEVREGVEIKHRTR